MKNKKEIGFILCWTCGDRIRFANLKYHKDLGHDVRQYHKDPRSKKKK